MTAPIEYSANALILSYEAAAGCTIGEAVVFASDTTIQDAGGASDLIIGIAAETATTGNMCKVYMIGHAVVPVTVGTGDATRGTKAIHAADGFTDATTHNSDGTGNESTYGVFLQSGVATNRVGLMLCGVANRGT